MAEIIEDPKFRNRTHVFDNRFHAGRLLAEMMRRFSGRGDAVILAIPAGGVQVARVVADTLRLPLDVAVTRKLHIPWNQEAGFGAVSWDGVLFVNEPLTTALGLSKDIIARVVAEERRVIEQRLRLFRGDRPFPELGGKTVIIIDDGLASGFSMLATIKTVRQRGAEEIVAAVPTAPSSAVRLVEPYVERIYCLNIRSGPVFAVADAYKIWYDIGDEEVGRLLKTR